NLKTGVIKHPKEGDIILNDAYEALGSHYVTAIMPTGVRKPKHYPQNHIIFKIGRTTLDYWQSRQIFRDNKSA
ncbi:MAG: hypothetical protein PHR65_11010, partial [Syntrophomonadaceae bacterium]|nr:hypothetical protein [Syntrophomonadaceae bacterium]